MIYYDCKLARDGYPDPAYEERIEEMLKLGRRWVGA